MVEDGELTKNTRPSIRRFATSLFARLESNEIIIVKRVDNCGGTARNGDKLTLPIRQACCVICKNSVIPIIQCY